jgi:hypothetical protein
MSDIEQGLKEAIAEAQARGPRTSREADIVAGAHQEYVEGSTYTGHIVRSPQRIFGRTGNGEDKRPPLTAPQVIETIEVLTKHASEIDNLAIELAADLAGRHDDAGPSHLASPAHDGMSLFDRMGLRLLDLTRVLESIEREVKRSLGAVKP